MATAVATHAVDALASTSDVAPAVESIGDRIFSRLRGSTFSDSASLFFFKLGEADPVSFCSVCCCSLDFQLFILSISLPDSLLIWFQFCLLLLSKGDGTIIFFFMVLESNCFRSLVEKNSCAVMYLYRFRCFFWFWRSMEFIGMFFFCFCPLGASLFLSKFSTK